MDATQLALRYAPAIIAVWVVIVALIVRWFAVCAHAGTAQNLGDDLTDSDPSQASVLIAVPPHIPGDSE